MVLHVKKINGLISLLLCLVFVLLFLLISFLMSIAFVFNNIAIFIILAVSYNLTTASPVSFHLNPMVLLLLVRMLQHSFWSAPIQSRTNMCLLTLLLLL